MESVCELGIAYNNTFVTKITDFIPCVMTSVSDKENVDLAMLQLKSKQTPDGKHVLLFLITMKSKALLTRLRICLLLLIRMSCKLSRNFI